MTRAKPFIEARSSKLEARGFQSWRLVEPCAGAAALTLHLLGSKHALLPYQGSKWKVRRALEAFLRSQGICGPPSAVWLNDVGPFGRTWGVLATEADRVVRQLEAMGCRDPKEVFDELQRAVVPEGGVRFAAEHLFLQRLSHSGKAVEVRGGRWVSPGFNKNSAYGCPETSRFGAVRPMIPHLVEVVRGVRSLFWSVEILAAQTDLNVLLSGESVLRNVSILAQIFGGGPQDAVVILVDPPYASATGYGGKKVDLERLPMLLPPPLSVSGRPSVPTLVVVCEAGPVESLVRAGWSAQQLSGRTDGESPFRSTKPEWITWQSVNWPSLAPGPVSGAGAGGG